MNWDAPEQWNRRQWFVAWLCAVLGVVIAWMWAVLVVAGGPQQ